MTPEELKRKRYKMEKCVCCGREWNVSRKAEIPADGYICPHCRERRGDKKTASVGAIVAGLALYAFFAPLTTAVRGYFAIGGEIIFPLIFVAFGIYGLITLYREKTRNQRKAPPVANRRRRGLTEKEYRQAQTQNTSI